LRRAPPAQRAGKLFQKNSMDILPINAVRQTLPAEQERGTYQMKAVGNLQVAPVHVIFDKRQNSVRLEKIPHAPPGVKFAGFKRLTRSV
jgi:hypothetical protein